MLTAKIARKTRELNEGFNKIVDLIAVNRARIVQVDVELLDDTKMISDIKRYYNRILPQLTGDKLSDAEAKLADDALLLADAIEKYDSEKEGLASDIAQCKGSVTNFDTRLQASVDWTTEEKAAHAANTTSVINEA